MDKASVLLRELLQMSFIFLFFFIFFCQFCVIQSFYVSAKTSSRCITFFVNVCKDGFYSH